MAIKTSALIPFNITSIPDRLTPLFCTDKTSVVSTIGTGAVKRLNRVQSSNFDMSTAVSEISEQGAQQRVGGIDELGEVKFKIDFNAVGLNNLAALLGVPQSLQSGSVTSIGLAAFQSATLDLFRLTADPLNNVFGSLYMQDCVVDDYIIDVKEKGLVTDGISGRGPNAQYFPGYFIPKTYLVSASDVTNGYLSLSTVLGADEQPVQVYLPTAIANPVAPTGAIATTGGTLAIGAYNYKVTAYNGSGETVASPSFLATTTTATSMVTLTITAVTGATGYNIYRSIPGGAAGTETFLNTTLTLSYVDNGSVATNAARPIPSANTTSGPSSYWQQNGTQFFFKIERVPGANLNAPTTRYYEANSPNGKTATYISATSRLSVSDTLVAGDLFRIVFMSYNTDSFPTTIPLNTPDNPFQNDRMGVSARLVPVKISAAQIFRVQSASVKFSLKRDHVQGVGEQAIVYGVPSIPDVAISFDVKETDFKILSLLSTGSQNLTGQGGTIQNDFQGLNYITRVGLAQAIPFSIVVNDPFSVGNVLMTLTTPQLVIKDIGYSMSNKADNTLKVSALDIQGGLQLTATHP